MILKNLPVCFVVALALTVSRESVAQQKWKLVEDLRIGGADTGAASLSTVRDLAVDAKGKVWLLDAKTREIRLFDATGKFLRVVGRQGAGPGEYRESNGMRVAPDGLVWVNDFRNARFDVFSSEGIFVKQVAQQVSGYAWRWDADIDPQGRLLEAISLRATAAGPPAQGVRRFDPKTATFDTLAVPPCLPGEDEYPKWSYMWSTKSGSGVISVPFSPLRVTRIDPSGAWWCATGSDAHAKLVRLGTGETLADVHSKSPTLTIPAAVRDSVIATLVKSGSTYPPGTIDPSRVPKTYPRLEAIDVDDKGRAWFRRVAPAGVTFDIVSRNGIVIATADVAAKIGRYDAVVIRDDRLYAVQRDDDDVPVVVRYKVVR